jgi:hypothetical protein
MESQFPQSGVWFDHEWALVFDVEAQAFRDWVYDNKIPHVSAFRSILVDAADIVRICKKVRERKPPSPRKGVRR